MGRKIVILGNGIAGITAARHVRKRGDDDILVISGETDHFFSRTALMYIYMGHMRFEDTKPYEDGFWAKNRIALERAWVRRVDFEQKRLELADGSFRPYDVLVLATGSQSNKFGWPGQDLDGVQGLYGYPDLLAMERSTAGIDRAVVVGGGLIGIETIEMLHSRGIHATFVVRERSWMDFAYPAEESAMIDRHIREHGIDYRLGTEIEAILPDESGRVRAVTLKGGDEIPCRFVALTVGVRPNVDLLRDSMLELDRGILVDGRLRTSVPDVYAIGDCAQLREPEPGRRAIEAVWYVGRRMGETVARTITGDDTPYDPGIWFNSAKFLDLEWQVYGDVPPRPPEGVGNLYWEHPDGRIAIRIRYRESDLAVTGFNLMGIRYRHEVCHRWISDGTPVPTVLRELGAANFDPELFEAYEPHVVARWNETHPEHAVPEGRRRGLRAALDVLRRPRTPRVGGAA